MASNALMKKFKIGSGQSDNSRHTVKVRKPPWQCLKRFLSFSTGAENQVQDLTAWLTEHKEY